MKKIVLIFCLIFSAYMQAHQTEGHIKILNENGTHKVVMVQLYEVSDLANPIKQALSYSYAPGAWPEDANFAFDTTPDWDPLAQWTFPNEVLPGNYRLRIENKYILLTITEPYCGDFALQYQNEEFSVLWIQQPQKVIVSTTKDWDLPITFNQKKANGIDNIGNVGVWIDTGFEYHLAPHTFNLIFENYYGIHADTNIIDQQKYNKWDFTDDVVNFNQIYVGSTPFSIQSNFSNTYNNMILGNELEYSSINGGNIIFKDPWLIDIVDPPHGRRNGGITEAFPWNRTSPFSPDYNTNYQGNIYKGVFLDQEIAANKPYYSVQAISPQPVTLNNRIHNFYFQNWDYDPNKISLQYPSALETGVVFKQDNATLSANMKGTQLSSQTDAFENFSQRKFVKTNDGIMHLVYESMGKVWYEKSTDNGANWTLMNGGKSLSFTNISKNPSICYAGIDRIFVVYQCLYGSTNYIRLMLIDYITDTIIDDEFVISIPVAFEEENSSPVVSWTVNHNEQRFIVVWNETNEVDAGLWAVPGKLDGQTFQNITIFPNNIVQVDVPDYRQYNLSLFFDDNYGTDTSKFQLVWQRDDVQKFLSNISYAVIQLSIPSNSITLPVTDHDISSSPGYEWNTNPSLAVWSDHYARICWIGSREEENGLVKKVLFTASDNTSHYWVFGNDVTSTNINRTGNTSGAGIGYIIGWSENNTTNKIVDNYLSSSHIRTISSTGRAVQISDGATFTNMYATALNTANSNHLYFNQSSNIQTYYDNPSKINSLSISEGREGIVSKNKLQFYFGVGDVKVDGSTISFKEIEDSIRFNNLSTLNGYLTTEPFQLTDNSAFYYSVQFGVTDTSQAENSLSEDSFVKFKVLLIDDNTNQVLGVYDEVTYTLENLLQHENIAYQVNTNGIGNKTVRLALDVLDNITPKYALAEKYADDYVITKEKYENIVYQGKLAVTEYALSQNYPNPFNPTTTINYQIPKTGRVVLRVYDILGKEVATLVNEEKEVGRYSVNFDASSAAGGLSSGVYLYELVVNDYKNVKKLMILK